MVTQVRITFYNFGPWTPYTCQLWFTMPHLIYDSYSTKYKYLVKHSLCLLYIISHPSTTVAHTPKQLLHTRLSKTSIRRTFRAISKPRTAQRPLFEATHTHDLEQSYALLPERSFQSDPSTQASKRTSLTYSEDLQANHSSQSTFQNKATHSPKAKLSTLFKGKPKSSFPASPLHKLQTALA